VIAVLDIQHERSVLSAHRKGAGVILELLLEWIYMVSVHMRIAKHMYQLPWSQVAHLENEREHHMSCS